MTLGLYASNEGDVYQWKRFDPKTITLETEYNYPPHTPRNLGTNPSATCGWGPVGDLIGDAHVSLFATIEDPDSGNLEAEFQLSKLSLIGPPGFKVVATQSVPTNNGKVATWSVPDSTLPNGIYKWAVRAKDQDRTYSDWTACTFRMDRSRPSKPPVISSPSSRMAETDGLPPLARPEPQGRSLSPPMVSPT